MKMLNEKEWKDFLFPEIFEIKKGFYNKKPDTDGTGKIPFLGATDSNNGVTRFLTIDEIDNSSKTGDSNNTSIEKKIFNSNAIAVTNNGSVGYSYYQANKFTCSHDINPLYLKDHTMNENEAQFLIKTIEKQGELFQYARKWRPIRMVKSRILLPINENNKPDYEYMEKYASNKRNKLIARYKAFEHKQINDLEYKVIPKLNEKEWKPILLIDIFELIRGKENNMKSLKEGMLPLISAKAIDNGLKGFVYTEKDTIKGNCITLNNDGDGGAGYAFYQPSEMALDSHVTALLPKIDISKYTMMFMARCISSLRGFFGHGLSISNKRAKKIKIMLPVDNQGNPDYEYMEQYVKNMMLKKYQQYLDFLEKQETKEK